MPHPLVRLRPARARPAQPTPGPSPAPPLPDAGLACLAPLRACLLRLVLHGHTTLTDEGLAHLATLTSLEELDLQLHDARGRWVLHRGLVGAAQGAVVQLLLLVHRGPTWVLHSKGWASGTGSTQARCRCCDNPPAPGPHHLCRLSPARNDVTDAGVRLLGTLSSLRALRLGSCAVQAGGCGAIARLGGLTALDLRDCATLTDTALFSLAPLGALHHLSLAGCEGVSDIGVAALARKTPRLTRLDLSGCHRNISDTTLSALGALRDLRQLDVSHCVAVSDAGLAELLPRVPQLEWLACRDCSITNEGCALLAAHAHALQHLRHAVGVGWGAGGHRRLHRRRRGRVQHPRDPHPNASPSPPAHAPVSPPPRAAWSTVPG